MIYFVYTITSIIFFWAGLYIGTRIAAKKLHDTINAMDKQFNDLVKQIKND
jgi:uncharacterized membrane protein YdjX (TVP38/TMEM64 family)